MVSRELRPERPIFGGHLPFSLVLMLGLAPAEKSFPWSLRGPKDRSNHPNSTC